MAADIRGALAGALATLLTLVGGMALGVAAGSWLFEGLPGHIVTRAGLAALPALGGVLAAGAAWGWALARLFRLGPGRAAARAGLLGFSLPVIAAAFLLFGLEAGLLGLGALLGIRQFPVHRLFTTLLVPAAFAVTAAGVWALGGALGVGWPRRRAALQTGAAAALAFLATNLLMENLGWVVGAPGAAERNTMITVLFYGLVAAALAGGATLGWRLARWPAEQARSDRTARSAGKPELHSTPGQPANLEELR